MAVVNEASTDDRGAPSTRARTRRSNAIRSTRSPARDASAVSSSVASIDASSRGMPPTRPAEVRPVSSTITTRRSRSGRQVRTMTSPRRAVARQSIERTSSPTTYSRSESNSVPCPRISVGAARRSRAAWTAATAGACGAERRQHPDTPGTRWRPCRPASPSGPIDRTMTSRGHLVAAPVRGERAGRRAGRPPAAVSTAWRGSARALGGQASRIWARSGRRPGLCTVTATGRTRPAAPGCRRTG